MVKRHISPLRNYKKLKQFLFSFFCGVMVQALDENKTLYPFFFLLFIFFSPSAASLLIVLGRRPESPFNSN